MSNIDRNQFIKIKGIEQILMDEWVYKQIPKYMDQLKFGNNQENLQKMSWMSNRTIRIYTLSPLRQIKCRNLRKKKQNFKNFYQILNTIKRMALI